MEIVITTAIDEIGVGDVIFYEDDEVRHHALVVEGDLMNDNFPYIIISLETFKQLNAYNSLTALNKNGDTTKLGRIRKLEV